MSYPALKSLRAFHCAPSGVVVRRLARRTLSSRHRWLRLHDRTSSESVIGITQPLSGSFLLVLGAMAPLQRPVIAAERQSTQILSAPLAAAVKGAPEPTVEIRYQGTGWDRLFAQLAS